MKQIMFRKTKSIDKETLANKIIVALDVDKEEEALTLVRHLSPPINFFKIGLRLYVSCGPRIITGLKKMGVKVFLDLKLHDIPHTVAATADVITRMGVDMFNIHLSGGRDMIESTVMAVEEAAREEGKEKPYILGVTLLSSINEKILREEVGIESNLVQYIINMAGMGAECGVNGVVASPREAAPLRKEFGEDFIITAAGVRPLWASLGDQLRVLTPRQALDAGASYLVIGRPIIEQPTPREAVEKILAEAAR